MLKVRDLVVAAGPRAAHLDIVSSISFDFQCRTSATPEAQCDNKPVTLPVGI